MSQMFKIRLRIYIIIVSFLFNLPAHSQNRVQESISNLVSNPSNKNAKISFKAIDLATGKEVASYNSSLAIPSASTTKLFSTATAFQVLGSNFVTSTRIYYKGKIGKDSVLYGDIYIRGGGDVSLGSRFFCEKGKELAFLHRWTDSLKAKGIKKIQISRRDFDLPMEAIRKQIKIPEGGNYFMLMTNPEGLGRTAILAERLV